MSSLFDHYLLFRLRTKRDEQAFAELYDRYATSIYRFVYLKLSSKEMAEDVTAETFLKCWQFIQANHVISNFRALLYRIARNLVVDVYRKSATGDSSKCVTFDPRETSTVVEDQHQNQDSLVSDRFRGQIRMEGQAELALFMKRLDQLKEDYRDVLMLRLIEDLTFGDIAKILEKAPGHVRVIYHRAMKSLEELNRDQSS